MKENGVLRKRFADFFAAPIVLIWQENVPLRIRKAVRVLCGGARETESCVTME